MTLMVVEISQLIANMNLTDQTGMRSYYKRGKIISNARRKRMSPERPRICKARLPHLQRFSGVLGNILPSLTVCLIAQ